jgi:hypothetical protein
MAMATRHRLVEPQRAGARPQQDAAAIAHQLRWTAWIFRAAVEAAPYGGLLYGAIFLVGVANGVVPLTGFVMLAVIAIAFYLVIERMARRVEALAEEAAGAIK